MPSLTTVKGEEQLKEFDALHNEMDELSKKLSTCISRLDEVRIRFCDDYPREVKGDKDKENGPLHKAGVLKQLSRKLDSQLITLSEIIVQLERL